MKKPKAKEMTLRLSPSDAAQITGLASAFGWTDAATVRQCMRVGFAAIAREDRTAEQLLAEMDIAAKSNKIRREADDRIAALKNSKRQPPLDKRL